MRRFLPLLAAALLVASAACETNRSGHVSAPMRGPLEAPLAERSNAMKGAREEACGSGAPTARGTEVLRRRPYLQNLDEAATSVLFSVDEASGAADSLSLAVTTPDGDEAGTASIGATDTLSQEGTVPVRARVEDLSPYTMYCYQIYEGDVALTEPAGFRTAPKDGDRKTPFGFVAMGDSGDASTDQLAVLEQILTVDHEFVVHVGDIAYSNGTLDQFDAHHFSVYQDLFGLVPFFPSPGNHDYGTDHGAPYLDLFELPENGDPADPERYYSFDYGPIHFISLDTNDLTDAQVEWVARDLESTAQPFVIAYGHHPPYSSGDHGSSSKVRDRIGPLLAQHGVQLMLTGHDHHYERTKPMDGVTYVVTGGGGVGTRPTGASSFTALSGEVLHHVFLEYDGTNLVMHAIDATGEEFDNLLFEPR